MKIAVTRLEEKSGGTRELFSKYGHDAILVPTMKTEIPDNPASLDELCRKVTSGKVDFLIFSSTMGAKRSPHFHLTISHPISYHASGAGP